MKRIASAGGVGPRVRLAVGRTRVVFAGVCAACLIVGIIAAPGGALGRLRPHANGLSGAAASSRVHDDTGQPLTLTNIQVTDLANNQTSVYSWSNTAPTYSPDSGCNGSTLWLCMSYGEASGPDGGSFSMVVGAPGFEAGTYYPDVGGLMTVTAGGGSCGEFANGGISEADLELDQYRFTSGSTPVQAVALQFDCTNSQFEITGTIAYNIFPTDPGAGYYLYGQLGEVGGFGNDNYLDYLDGPSNLNLNAPIVGMATTSSGAGYWMTGSDGGVFASGDAGFYGSTGSLHLNKPIVGMAATPDGRGYWLVASDGGVFAFGDAGFYGSTGSLHLNQPVVGMAATHDGGGYWMVASDGGIFAFGDAGFYGSTGGQHLNEPIVGMAATPDGRGYWLVASDGGVFTFGSAPFDGSLGGTGVTDVVGIAVS